MDKLLGVDWENTFAFTVSPLEIIIRGTLVYLALFAILRFVLKREAGTVGITDLLVIVLIADAAQNAMASDYKSVTDGIILVATIVFWSFALDWLGYHIPAIQRFVRPPPLKLVQHGRMLRQNMRKELITEDELMSMLRQQGVNDLSKVKWACMEGDGKISVVTYEKKEDTHKAPEKQVS